MLRLSYDFGEKFLHKRLRPMELPTVTHTHKMDLCRLNSNATTNGKRGKRGKGIMQNVEEQRSRQQ